jgi:hypothetical protein
VGQFVYHQRHEYDIRFFGLSVVRIWVLRTIPFGFGISQCRSNDNALNMVYSCLQWIFAGWIKSARSRYRQNDSP